MLHDARGCVMAETASSVEADAAPTPTAVRSKIILAAHLSWFVYWWTGPETHCKYEDLAGISGDVNNPLLKPPKYGPVKPFGDAGEVQKCIQHVVAGLGPNANLELWEPEQHACLISAHEGGKKRLVVVFRGTFDGKDILSDVKVNLVNLSHRSGAGNGRAPPGKVHSGFLKHLSRGGGLERMLQRIDELAAGASSDAPVEVLITGHSLGAAVATLFTSLLLAPENGGSAPSRAVPLHVTLVTFGSPRCGDFTFALGLAGPHAGARLHTYRVQNEFDPISRVPWLLPTPGAYVHHQSHHVWLDRGVVHTATGPIPKASVPINPLFWARRWVHGTNLAGIAVHKMGTKTGYVLALEKSVWPEEARAEESAVARL